MARAKICIQKLPTEAILCQVPSEPCLIHPSLALTGDCLNWFKSATVLIARTGTRKVMLAGPSWKQETVFHLDDAADNTSVRTCSHSGNLGVHECQYVVQVFAVDAA
ncbi:unnamed protein product, partial [Ectocarpus sp. 4 AP-2014]